MKKKIKSKLKHLISFWRILWAKKWVVVVMHESRADLVLHNFDTHDAKLLGKELQDMAAEQEQQEQLLQMFQNNH